MAAFLAPATAVAGRFDTPMSILGNNYGFFGCESVFFPPDFSVAFFSGTVLDFSPEAAGGFSGSAISALPRASSGRTSAGWLRTGGSCGTSKVGGEELGGGASGLVRRRIPPWVHIGEDR